MAAQSLPAGPRRARRERAASRTRRRDKLFSHANKCEQLHEYLITLVSYSAQVLRAPICPRHASCTGLFLLEVEL